MRILLEGESLLNDASGLTLFEVFLHLVRARWGRGGGEGKGKRGGNMGSRMSSWWLHGWYQRHYSSNGSSP
jgi:hypothetical protein